MNINECIEQLNSLLEHFENGGNDFNATDVIAIKNLLEENKKLNGAIQTYDILLKANAEENKQLKEQLLVSQTNEETFRLEMADITKTLGLDEDTIFDDVKVCIKNLKNNWNKLWQYLLEKDNRGYEKVYIDDVLDEMKELQGSDE